MSSSMAPQPMTMERLGTKPELLMVQSTSQFCRCCCFQKSINWVLAEQDNFEPGTNPFDLDSVGWIHEESGYCHRWWSWLLPGCRQVKYVQHSGPPPSAILGENQDWFSCQKDEVPLGLGEDDQKKDVVAIHQKGQTCGYCFNFGDCSFPICCCLPYLTSETPDGKMLGKTEYVCDLCCFVPKYDVSDASGETIYRIRPDTCVAGMCVRCRCDGSKGKCCRVPFVVRNPATKEPIHTAKGSGTKERVVQIDNLWAGWKHECCTQKDAYHVVFPSDSSTEEKIVLMGACLLIDMTMFEQMDS